MPSAVLITGGAKRLGQKTALYLASHQYDIALHYHRSCEQAEVTASKVRALGMRCELFAADLSDSSTCGPLIQDVYKAFPNLSALVNNASVFDPGTFMESTPELYAKEFQINLEAPIFLTQAFAKYVKQGAVVNMLDTHITRNKHSYFFYLLSKKTLAEFTRMAAVELAPGIRVNGVCPGYVLPAEGWEGEYRKQLEAKLPLGGLASVDDVIHAIRLCIETTSLTGQYLFIDGGEHLL